MGKKITWYCDTCHREAEGTQPPPGWTELSYWDVKFEKFRRHCFCTNACAKEWLNRQELRKTKDGPRKEV